MLTLQLLRDQPEQVVQRLQKKHFQAGEIVEAILRIDQERRKIQAQNDALLAEANELARSIGDLFKQGKKDEAESLRQRTGELKEETKKLGEQLQALESQLQEKITELPNLPHDSVPEGKTPQDNVTVREGGSKPSLPTDAKPHWDLAEQYNLIDFALGNKVTGAGFPVYLNKGARLQRALINYFLDKALETGYRECQPPILVNTDSAFGTGQLPDKEGQMYAVERDQLYVIPTAEVPLTNIYRDVILDEAQFPVKMVGYTPCFRREAGSYGKDVRGLNRLHQFDKVEIVQVRKPEESYQALEEMVAHVESLLVALQLPYRILRLCGGDMSFTSALTYDFEVYAAAQDRWLEVSSVSNFESFQANRLKLRYKEDKTNKLAHTLNGSALALPRIVAALLENNQQPDGISIPAPLVPYTGFAKID
ncbi:MAG: serine--tRNA ligase [Flavobacteriales bacterium]|nr:serine--tRNA ligase [Flavobacteriales bacterium]MCB9449204.1 serine--tRNA ligase [Flavobacteriales bacterium]